MGTTDSAETWRLLSWAAPLLLAAIAVSAVAIMLLRPWLERYALARPNARSSHTRPTPQGGGIAVVATTLVLATGATAIHPALGPTALIELVPLLAASVFLLIVGAVDDIRTLAALPRLILQCLAVIVVVGALPADMRMAAWLPLWLERALLVLGGLWFVNLVNFMDGLDWMTVAEIVPVTAALIGLGLVGALPPLAVLVACALLGAMLGFAPFNRPVARLFLGDVGSLPIGLIAGWLLLQLALRGHLAAASLLPLYYIADATLTLLRRLMRGDAVTQAHRTHFYQRATDNGLKVNEIVGLVFITNIALAVLALGTIVVDSTLLKIAFVVLGIAAVAALLGCFARGRR
jgi:UDP-N-acetylmuramyl pentapeptide phosphotransferase/UDP-N-acetylglucosamine-1-phosphate transferase